jgi:hypothetical protein
MLLMQPSPAVTAANIAACIATIVKVMVLLLLLLLLLLLQYLLSLDLICPLRPQGHGSYRDSLLLTWPRDC